MKHFIIFDFGKSFLKHNSSKFDNHFVVNMEQKIDVDNFNSKGK